MIFSVFHQNIDRDCVIEASCDNSSDDRPWKMFLELSLIIFKIPINLDFCNLLLTSRLVLIAVVESINFYISKSKSKRRKEKQIYRK